MRNLLRGLAARHGPFVLCAAALLGAFEFLICAAVASADVGGALETLLDSLPPIVQTMVGSQLLGGVTTSGLIAFGWNHPIAHALGTAVAIVLASRAIAGEVEAGTIELALAQPVSRLRYLGAQVVFASMALVLLCAAGVAGTVAGQRVFGLEPFAPATFLRLAANALALYGAWFGVALLLSAFGREGGRVAGLAFLVAVASYVVDVIGTAWNRAEFLLPYSPHHYFSPRDILVGEEGIARPLAVLITLAATGVAVAWARFRARDLP